MDESNPYAPPQSTPVDVTKPEHVTLRRMAVLSWLVPLVGFGFALTTSVLFDSYTPWLGKFGFLLFVPSSIIGFVLSVICLTRVRRYRRLLGSAVLGLVFSTLALLVTGPPVYMWLLMKTGLSHVQQNLRELESALERYEQDRDTP